MVVLRKEIPATTVLDMDWEGYGKFIGKSGVDKDLLKIAMTKAAAPVGVEDLRELMGPIRRLYNQLLDKEADTSKKNVLKVIGGLIDAIDKEEVYKLLADIIREIQGKCLYRQTENFYGRFCDLQKADADVDRGAGPFSDQEKPLLELQRALGGRGEWEERGSSFVGTTHRLDDQGIHCLQGRVLPVDQPMVLDVRGEVLMCKGLVP